MSASDPNTGCSKRMGGSHLWRKANKASGGATYCVHCFMTKGSESKDPSPYPEK